MYLLFYFYLHNRRRVEFGLIDDPDHSITDPAIHQTRYAIFKGTNNLRRKGYNYWQRYKWRTLVIFRAIYVRIAHCSSMMSDPRRKC